MRDNEIIRAEKVIKDLHAYCFCSQSVFKKMGYNFTESDFDCVNNLFHIIDRQKAIIEKSEKVEHFADKTIETANAEIERLQKNIDGLNIFTKNHIKVITLQAIKEFAERLKHFIIPQKADGYTREIVLKRDIDNLVKEMAGDTK